MATKSSTTYYFFVFVRSSPLTSPLIFRFLCVTHLLFTTTSAFGWTLAFATARRQFTSFHMTTTTTSTVLPPAKFHHFTVCLVPPEREERVWELLTRARTELQDAGFYRWPPHVNLLYPFCDPYDLNNTNTGNETSLLDSDVVHRLEAACRQVEPFHVQLAPFGTFGGKARGVLWLYPSSSLSSSFSTASTSSPCTLANDGTTSLEEQEPVLRLQRLLEEQFPYCNEQRLVGQDGGFKPHMTLSHFGSRPEAEAAQEQLTKWWPTNDNPLQFLVDEIYLMHRRGDVGGGQFERVASIPLGRNGRTQFMQGPFRQMPHEEYGWVKEARKIMKQRRNRQGRRGRGNRNRRGDQRQSRRSLSPRVPDTPEVIAAKRAERKAKREALEQHQQE